MDVFSQEVCFNESRGIICHQPVKCSAALFQLESLSGSLGPVVNEGSSSGSAVLLPRIQRSRELRGWVLLLRSPCSLNHRELPGLTVLDCCLPGLLGTRPNGLGFLLTGEFPDQACHQPGPRQPFFSIPSAIPPSHPTFLFSLTRAGAWSLFFNFISPFAQGMGSH